MTAPLNVLVTAASRRVPLVRAFGRALDALGVPGRVVVTDVNPLSPAVHVADAAYEVPLSTSPGYLDVVQRICEAEDVRLVVPTIDDELPVFADAVAQFRAAGRMVAVSSLDTTLACNDKYETCRRLREAGVAAAATFLPDQLPPHPDYPIFLKPRYGRGSIGAHTVQVPRHLPFFLDLVPQPVLQTYLDGPEYTIDLFCDAAGTPVSAVPRERVVVRAGVIDRGRTVRDPALIDLALACARVFPFFGPINVQCRVVKGVPTVFEINPRFSGGIPLTIAAGADFPRWLIELALGRTLAPVVGQFTDRLWMTNYEEGIFLGEERLSVLRSPARESSDPGR